MRIAQSCAIGAGDIGLHCEYFRPLFPTSFSALRPNRQMQLNLRPNSVKKGQIFHQ